MTNYIEYLFMGLLALVSSLETHLFNLLNGFSFYYLDVRVPFISCIQFPYQMCDLQIFSPIIWVVFFFLLESSGA